YRNAQKSKAMCLIARSAISGGRHSGAVGPGAHHARDREAARAARSGRSRPRRGRCGVRDRGVEAAATLGLGGVRGLRPDPRLAAMPARPNAAVKGVRETLSSLPGDTFAAAVRAVIAVRRDWAALSARRH